MKLLWRALLVTVLVALSVLGADEDNGTSAGDSAQSNTICSSCKCDNDKKTLDCTELQLSKLFLPKDWTDLKSTLEMKNVFFVYNNLENITQFPDLPIEILDFSHNQIVYIEKRAFANLTELTELDLSNNRLESSALTPEIFEGHYDPVDYEPLKKLKVLKLSYNNLHTLDPDLFEHLSNLEELSIDNNPFKVISSSPEIAISTIRKLRVLNMGDMELTSLPEHIFHAPRTLEEVNLENNQLETIPKALLFAINLKKLVLDGNPIKRIGSNFSNFPPLTKMRVLSISHMPLLERIENHGLSNLENLEELDCSDNYRLNFIHKGALSRPGKEEPSDTEWPMVKKLYLQNNNLSVVDSMLLSRWDIIEEIDLTNNPWMCACQTQWIVDIILDKNNKAESNANMVCEYPLEMRGMKMVDLEHHQLRCVDLYGHRPERDGAVLVGVLIGVLIGIPIALMIVLIYKRGCFGLVSTGPADFSRAFYKRTANDEINF